jgi:hypothetical protein
MISMEKICVSLIHAWRRWLISGKPRPMDPLVDVMGLDHLESREIVIEGHFILHCRVYYKDRGRFRVFG